MPTLTWLYLGERIPVSVWGMLFTALKIVIAPVCIGVLINHLAGPRLHCIKPVFPVISVIAIVLIIAIIVAVNHDAHGGYQCDDPHRRDTA